ncbi:DNA cytosine methyltransferase [Clostridium tertium]|uniref:DNA cytosine methyltransferase n=1 Tax=Clostridium tertium TaxID=1559 RepID=UPI000DCFE49B|nr:DNA cytosine methyltransferase [Clostridium tertium]MDB1939484.1 DNA cytosine methyltransferase [Clostridium tertium]
MIFKSVSKINNRSEKNFFLEKVNVFIRLVEVFCEKNSIDMENDQNIGIIHELYKIGVIEIEDELQELKKVLGKQYDIFINAVSTAIVHKDKMNGLLDKLYNSRRENLQKKVTKKSNLSLVDFFCGAGGLSLGFLQQGFNVKLANDIEDVCIETYKYNHPELPSNHIIQGDIKEILHHIDDFIEQDIDIVVGGPPCQGFSEANRQRIIDDPRNKLYKYFLNAIEIIAPKFVVMENVKGMLKVANQVVEDYEKLVINKNEQKLGYKVSYKILNSHDFSVAQSRERLIYIAVRNDVIEEKKITPDRIFEEIEISCKKNKKYVLKDALKDIKALEAPRIKNMNEIDSEITGKKIDINIYEYNDNEYLKLINIDRKIPYIFNHKARYCNDVNYQIYSRLNQGDDATDEKIKDVMPYAHRNHCFKDKYYKLIADRPCRTITAHLKMDCHSHIHPYQIRSLTPREAARVQSFPDDYLFLGAYLKTYMQIGNAVPPMMARGIAAVIKKYLN